MKLHETLQDECYSRLFRKKLCRSLEELQTDLDAWLEHYKWGAAPLRPVLLPEDPLGDLSGHQAPGAGKRIKLRR